MKIKTNLFALLILSAAASLCFAAADDAFMGTWKLNEAKSKIPEGAPKNNTVVYAQNGDEVTITVDGMDAGKAVHHVWTGKFDGWRSALPPKRADRRGVERGASGRAALDRRGSRSRAARPPGRGRAVASAPCGTRYRGVECR